MEGKVVREKFIKFFTDHNHKLYKSSGLIPEDESILFTTAGMVQMMPYLMREKEIENSKVCSVQKSFRTVDIDNIGSDGTHLTFFEMLGSWSFGDYYKKEAITLAYDLLVNHFMIDKNRLWVSIFEGIQGDNVIPRDTESEELWLDVGIEKSKIVALPFKDNFWGPPGLTGPCGPSTEIYYDNGEERGCRKTTCKPGCSCDRFVEIWNAGVFMEYYKDESSKFSRLPYTNVDTGAGLERLTAVLQNVDSVFKTDLFIPIVDKIKSKVPMYNNTDIKSERSVNIIADHIRGITFLIADGLAPSNEYRGYVLRRLLRRAMVQAMQIGGEFPFLSNIAESVILKYSDFYPELLENRDKIIKEIDEEELKFKTVLEKGIKRLDSMVEQLGTDKHLKGEDVFKLHDTYGLNIEIIKDILNLKNISFDEAEFDNLYKIQQDKSRTGSTFTLGKNMEIELQNIQNTEFVGYKDLNLKGSKVLYVLDLGSEIQFVLDKTPFFAEGGGQKGDMGEVVGKDFKIKVKNVRKTKKGVYLHIGEYMDIHTLGKKASISEGDIVDCFVDQESRLKTSYNHSTAHLLNKALKVILGNDISQKGAYIDDQRIRFDFNFDRQLTDDEIKKVEDLINKEISKNLDVKIKEMTLEEAEKLGVELIFKGKYSTKVRVIEIGDFSMELCGGTHFGNTKDFGKFKITKQESAGKGIRRIRAELSKNS
ncbi:MAG: alanine--tRNA ligase [Patescibacteria group bacterium]